MKVEKIKDSDSLEKEMKRLIRKLDSESDALNKILKITAPVESNKQSDSVKKGSSAKNP
jgi:hypothetical protein